MTSRTEKIKQRRQDMPRLYRNLYDRAVKGKSLRAAINSFCLECCGWQRDEVRHCTATACPLWVLRPYQYDTSPQDAHEGAFSGAESTNAADLAD